MTETGMAPAISGKDQKGPGRTKSIMQRASHARGKLLNTIRGMHASSEHSHPHTRYVTVFTLHTDCVPDHLLFQQFLSLSAHPVSAPSRFIPGYSQNLT